MTASYLPTPHAAPAGASDRGFGFTVGGILLGIVAVGWVLGPPSGVLPVILIALGALLVLLAAVAPGLLSVPNRIWTKLGLLLFEITNPVIMFLIYVTAFIPIGIFLRISGRRLLDTEIDPNAPSYWHDRTGDAFAASRMNHQF